MFQREGMVSKLMKQILVLVILVSLLAIAGFYIKFLRSENNRLEGLENGYVEQIEEMTQRAKDFEEIAQVREKEIQALNQSQRDFQDELEKARNNEDFRIWFDNPLPLDANRLLKKNSD